MKLGWDKIKDQFPDDEVVFFGAPGGLLRHLRANNGKLISIDKKLTRSLAFTSGGASEIDPTAYDAIVLFGLHLKLPRFRLGVTKAVRLETIKNLAERGLNLIIATRLRKLGDRKFWIGANPLEVAPGDLRDFGTFHSYDAILAEMQRIFQIPGVQFLPQPNETIGSDLRAPSRFAIGSVRLRPGKDGSGEDAHPEDEVRHMNGEFGQLCLLHNLPTIRQGTSK